MLIDGQDTRCLFVLWIIGCCWSWHWPENPFHGTLLQTNPSTFKTMVRLPAVYEPVEMISLPIPKCQREDTFLSGPTRRVVCFPEYSVTQGPTNQQNDTLKYCRFNRSLDSFKKHSNKMMKQGICRSLWLIPPHRGFAAVFWYYPAILIMRRFKRSSKCKN